MSTSNSAGPSAGSPGGLNPPVLQETSIAEIRDYFCCTFIWWLRNLPLALECQERLMRICGDPAMGRTRNVPFDIPKAVCMLLLSIASGIAGVVTWFSGLLFPKQLGAQFFMLQTTGYRFMIPAILVIWLWRRWRARTPRFEAAYPGTVLLDNTDPLMRRIFHSPRYGICGELDIVLRLGVDVLVMDRRTVETPRFLSDQNRMQLVAQALLAETEFQQRPKTAFLVHPDRTFEVRITPGIVRFLLDTVTGMRNATRTGVMPDDRPSWHLCPLCPYEACPERISSADDAVGS